MPEFGCRPGMKKAVNLVGAPPCTLYLEWLLLFNLRILLYYHTLYYGQVLFYVGHCSFQFSHPSAMVTTWQLLYFLYLVI